MMEMILFFLAKIANYFLYQTVIRSVNLKKLNFEWNIDIQGVKFDWNYIKCINITQYTLIPIHIGLSAAYFLP